MCRGQQPEHVGGRGRVTKFRGRGACSTSSPVDGFFCEWGRRALGLASKPPGGFRAQGKAGRSRACHHPSAGELGRARDQLKRADRGRRARFRRRRPALPVPRQCGFSSTKEGKRPHPAAAVGQASGLIVEGTPRKEVWGHVVDAERVGPGGSGAHAGDFVLGARDGRRRIFSRWPLSRGAAGGDRALPPQLRREGGASPPRAWRDGQGKLDEIKGAGGRERGGAARPGVLGGRGSSSWTPATTRCASPPELGR